MCARLSATWVAAVGTELTRSDRPIEGGWPGTRSEAKKLLLRHFARSRCPVPYRERLECLVDTLYHDAKQAWKAALPQAHRAHS